MMLLLPLATLYVDAIFTPYYATELSYHYAVIIPHEVFITFSRYRYDALPLIRHATPSILMRHRFRQCHVLRHTLCHTRFRHAIAAYFFDAAFRAAADASMRACGSHALIAIDAAAFAASLPCFAAAADIDAARCCRHDMPPLMLSRLCLLRYYCCSPPLFAYAISMPMLR